MGQEQSHSSARPGGVSGLQVARVLPESPAHDSGLLPFFDIITAVNDVGVGVLGDPADYFKHYVSSRVNQRLRFKVFNLHSNMYRDVFCVPSNAWGGPGVLGCSIEWSSSEKSRMRSWHIDEVLPGSPADKCGAIKAGRDYIIGMQRAEEPSITLIKDLEDFNTRVGLWRSLQRATARRLIGKANTPAADPLTAVDNEFMLGKLLFLVYDSVGNEIKEVAVDMWPDVDAPLGMSLATGLLHSLPTSSSAADTSTQVVESANHQRLPIITAFVTSSGSVEGIREATQALSITPSAPQPLPLSQTPEEQQQRQPSVHVSPDGVSPVGSGGAQEPRLEPFAVLGEPTRLDSTNHKLTDACGPQVLARTQQWHQAPAPVSSSPVQLPSAGPSDTAAGSFAVPAPVPAVQTVETVLNTAPISFAKLPPPLSFPIVKPAKPL
ncbi:GRASP55 65 PDZ like domain [Trypanosoma vivax]|uniref:Putative Golgi reassembly stacking protein (GRASP homologue) n=1 Tax=Trypanosoma vivax (strain Y486) TaxID=1055687 RepID=G0UAF4_TRYVY|nr:putative Golgi reassembly stacking protein [Trypanosoma vivax]KAH8617970.1 GRASP55 65 PDZ like domain [Trypanosoma vivax]CCC52787.1 putative Golgi reassembly stacking protein (GRASP homologue) [Trypanosoma vivax Y486]